MAEKIPFWRPHIKQTQTRKGQLKAIYLVRNLDDIDNRPVKMATE
jgi:hypothetical protein